MDLHQIIEPVKNASDVFGIQMARHLFHRTIHNQINVQLRTNLPDGSCQSYTVISWLERAALLCQVLLQVSTEERCIELGLEAEVVLDNNCLNIGIHHCAEDAVFKTRHRYRFIDKRILRTAQLA